MTNLNLSLEKNKRLTKFFIYNGKFKNFFEITLAIFLFILLMLYLAKFDGEKLLLSIPFSQLYF